MQNFGDNLKPTKKNNSNAMLVKTWPGGNTILLFLSSASFPVKLINKSWTCCKSSCPEVFFKEGVLKNSSKFIGKHLCPGLFFKKETLAQVFLWEFCEMFKNTFLCKHLWCLLLLLINLLTLHSQPILYEFDQGF